MTMAVREPARAFGLARWATKRVDGTRAWRPASLIPSGVEATGFAVFFLMLFVPTSYRSIKAALLALLLLALAARILIERRAALHPQVAFGCLLFSVLGAVFVLRGYLASAPGALRVSGVYVIWPWINALLITGLADEARLWRLARLLVWTTLAICLYCASFILWAAGWLPPVLYVPLKQGQVIAFYDGFMEFGIRSLASLLFLIPFVTGALLTWPRRGTVARATLWLALASGLVIGLLSGRRALQLVLALGLPAALIIRQPLPGDLRTRVAWGMRRSFAGAAVAGLVAVLILRLAFGIDLGALWAVFRTGFAFSSDPVAATRALQFDALIQGWLSSPLLGSGHGAPAPGLSRSAEMPWAYELSYVALLYHTGMIGMLLYGLGVAWIYVQGCRIIRRGTSLAPLMVATLTGTTTFLIANATNPYLEKFDCLWTMFLPVALINVSLLSGDASVQLGGSSDGSRQSATRSGNADTA
jgi:hypothetical protein